MSVNDVCRSCSDAGDIDGVDPVEWCEFETICPAVFASMNIDGWVHTAVDRDFRICPDGTVAREQLLFGTDDARIRDCCACDRYLCPAADRVCTFENGDAVYDKWTG